MPRLEGVVGLRAGPEGFGLAVVTEGAFTLEKEVVVVGRGVVIVAGKSTESLRGGSGCRVVGCGVGVGRGLKVGLSEGRKVVGRIVGRRVGLGVGSVAAVGKLLEQRGSGDPAKQIGLAGVVPF